MQKETLPAKKVLSRKHLLAFSMLGITLLGSAALLSRQALADTTQEKTLLDRLAERFGVEKKDVEKVFNEHQANRRVEHQAAYADRLSQAVSEGKLTESQKSAVLAKHDDLVRERESDRERWSSMTAEERRADAERRRSTLKSWAKDNGIDLSFLMPGMGPGEDRGQGRMHDEGSPRHGDWK